MATAPIAGPDVARAAAEVVRRCRSLARHSERPGETTRTFLCDEMRAVHSELGAWMTQAGMRVTVDSAGNLRGVSPGSGARPRRLYLGSHLDTVPRAGAFDGILGVVAGVALVELLADRRLPLTLEVIGFSEEEGVRFGAPFIGSRALAGTLDEALLARTDATGVTVAEALRRFGLDPAGLGAAVAADAAIGYFEMHIEQGPVLDAAGLPVGVVNAIVGQTRAEVTFIGVAGHAGTTPMHQRRDAVAAAAEWVLVVEAYALPTHGLVATVGHLVAEPGAGNVIAGQCRATLDVRHADNATRADAGAHIITAAREIAGRRGLEMSVRVTLDQESVAMDAALTRRLAKAVGNAGVRPLVMTSGAGHDAMVLSARLPAAMLFVRHPGGISHHPDEDVLEADIAVALAAACSFIDDLSGDHD